MTRSATFDQTSFWVPALPPQMKGLDSSSYETVTSDPIFSQLESVPIQSPYGFASLTPGEYTEWDELEQRWPSIEPIEPISPISETNQHNTVPIKQSKPQPQRRPRKPQSGEALGRRREQNRIAQVAFRDRSKRQMEEMRKELTQCVEFNHHMYMSIRELRDRTEALMKDMDAILAMQPPVPLLATHIVSRTNSSEPYLLPESLPDYCNVGNGDSITVSV